MTHKVSRLTRRTLVGASCALVLTVVAACGQGGPTAGPASPGPASASPPAAAAARPSSSAPPANQVLAYVTAFSWQDNNPPNSAAIGQPDQHITAGGQGTFDDPITAVASQDGTTAPHNMGTKYYLPTIQRYVVIQETDAPPGPPATAIHLAVWIDGRGGNVDQANTCEGIVTGTVNAYANPSPNLPVTPGPIAVNGICHVPGGS